MACIEAEALDLDPPPLLPRVKRPSADSKVRLLTSPSRSLSSLLPPLRVGCDDPSFCRRCCFAAANSWAPRGSARERGAPPMAASFFVTFPPSSRRLVEASLQ